MSPHVLQSESVTLVLLALGEPRPVCRAVWAVTGGCTEHGPGRRSWSRNGDHTNERGQARGCLVVTQHIPPRPEARGLTIVSPVSKGRGLSSPNDRTAHLRDAADKANGISGDDGDAYGADTLYSHENLHVLVYDWLNATFPNGGRNRFVNGAQGGVGAGYFAWCFSE